jgi:uncharacterized membrane protein (UPF0127 family)
MNVHPRTRNFAISILPLIMLVLLIVLISLAVYLYYTENETPPPVPLSSFQVERITISNGSTSNSTTTNSVIEGLVYVASTVDQQVQGFQNVTNFGNCNGFSSNSSARCIGMIFVTSSTQNLCFWMHDTPLALEQVWISSSYKVVYVFQAQPESEKSVCQNAQDVLETSPNMTVTLGEEVRLTPI